MLPFWGKNEPFKIFVTMEAIGKNLNFIGKYPM